MKNAVGRELPERVGSYEIHPYGGLGREQAYSGTVRTCRKVQRENNREPKILYHLSSIAFPLGVETGKDDVVQIYIIDDLLVTAADIFDKVPDVRIMEGLDGICNGVFLRLCKLLWGRGHAVEGGLRAACNTVFVKSV